MFKFFGRKGQSTMEYAMIAIILIGAMIGIQNYFKRAMQGRWKSAMDGVGEQYDPMQTTVDLSHSLNGLTVTNITTAEGDEGTQTFRADQATMTETKVGSTRVDAQ